MARKPKALKIAVYLRCSSDDQLDREYTTIDSQREITTLWAHQCVAVANTGGNLSFFLPDSIAKRFAGLPAQFVGEFADPGRTGTNLERPDYKRLAQLVASGDVNVVAVTYLSRLARGDAFSTASYHFKQDGAHIASIEEKFTDDAAGELAMKAQTFVDGFYAMQVSRHTKTKQAAMVAKGYWTGSKVPFGYEAQPVSGGDVSRNGSPSKKAVPTADAVHVVKAFETFVATRSIADVQRYLQGETMERWSIYRAQHLLTCETYRGVLVYGQNRNESAHEAIISAELWEAAQSAFAQRGTGVEIRTANGYQKDERKNDTVYYLRGYVRCVYCGCLMTPSYAGGKDKLTPYYTCTSGGFASKGKAECPIKRVNAGRLHTGVLEEIARVAAHPTRLDGFLREAVRLLPDASGLKNEAEKIKRRQKEAQAQIDRFLDILAKSKMDSPSVMARIKTLENELEATTVALADVQARVIASTARRPDTNALQALWSEFGENWAYLSDAERTEMLTLLVSRVEIEAKEKGTLHLFLQSPPLQVRFLNQSSSLCWTRTSNPLINSQVLRQLS